MNKQLFEDYLYSPNDMPASSVAELKQIIAEYPYFQTAHMLYIKSLHLNNSILYAAHLKQAACYARDRTLLFKLIKGQHAAVRHQPAIDSFAQSTDTSIAISGEIAPEPVTTPTTRLTVTEEQPTVEPLSERILRRLREIEQEHAQKEQSEATQSTVQTQVIQQIEEHQSMQPIVDEDDELLSFEDDDELPPLTPEQLNPQHKRIPPGKFTPQTIEYIHNLERKLAESGIDNFQETNNNRPEKSHDKLIDAFLTKQPRIIPKKPVQNEEIEDISTKSVEEPEIMTETIAKIYLNQEQYEKALKIYETLSLKYPQKSVYFADKISQIKELIKKSKKI